MQNFDPKKENDNDSEKAVYSQVIRAGKRTYFFDVKTATYSDDYYLAITESRRKQGSDGNFFFEKRKIVLYKEDIMKFKDGLNQVIDFMKKEKPDIFEIEHVDVKDNMESTSKSAADIEFEAL